MYKFPLTSSRIGSGGAGLGAGAGAGVGTETGIGGGVGFATTGADFTDTVAAGAASAGLEALGAGAAGVAGIELYEFTLFAAGADFSLEGSGLFSPSFFLVESAMLIETT